jgi:cytochrome c biogenesis protein CcmG/thiol:disulfide interchange protein DsbE
LSSGEGRLAEDDKAGGRRSWVTFIPVIAFVLIAAVFAVQILFGNDELDSALIGKPAPEFELPPLLGLLDANGNEVPTFDTQSLIGQVTLVNVWGSWCAPCRDEHPILMELAGDDRFQIYGLNQQDTIPGALGFLQDHGNPYDAVGIDPNQRVSIQWGVYGVPETYVVDRQGIVRYRFIGPLDEDRLANDLMPQIEKALAEPQA